MKLPPRARTWLSFIGAFWPFMLGTALIAGGVAAIVLGYLGVAGTLHVGLQLPYLVSGGLLGLALVVLGAGFLLLHALNRQARLLRRLLERIPAAGGNGGVSSGNGEAGDDVVVAVPGGRSYHRPACMLVAGKDPERLEQAAAAARGLEPCRLCDPAPVPQQA